MGRRRAGGWEDCSDKHQCPACLEAGRGSCPSEGNTLCSYNEYLEKTKGQAFTCGKGGEPAPAGWRVFSKNKKGFVVLVPSDATLVEEHDPAAQERAAKRRMEREKTSEQFREGARQKARVKWNLCGDELVLGTEPACAGGRGPGHPRAIAYFEARGVALADLPEAQLPRTLKYHGAMRDGMNAAAKDEAENIVFFELPAIVCAATGVKPGKDRVFKGIQRIYLDPDGRPAKALAPKGIPAAKWDAKRGQGSLTSAAVRLYSPLKSGVLILSEGIETGLACLAATHVGVWACISTSGLMNVELPASYVAEGGAVHTVIIAADCDRVQKKGKRPGQDAAAECAHRLHELYPRLKVRVATPAPLDAPALFDLGTGEPKEKSVDWLDIYNVAGKETVRQLLLDRSVMVFGESGGGDEGRGTSMLGGDMPDDIPEGELPMARTLLLDRAELSPPRGNRAGERFYEVNLNGTDYAYTTDGLPRYEKISSIAKRGRVWGWLQRYRRWKDGRLDRLNPGRKTAENVAAAMITETIVYAQTVPCWAPATFDASGKAIWADQRPVRLAQPAPWAIPCRNGILDVNQLMDGVVKLQPHTPRLFSLSCRPFSVDVELLRKLLRADDAEAWAIGEKHWPTWSTYLRSVSRGEVAWVELLQRMFGLCLTPDTSYERIFLLPGAPGSGKSTALEALSEIVGEEAYVTATLSSMSKDFGLIPLVGKNVVSLSDAGAGKYTDLGQALELLKVISGGDKVTVEYKGLNDMPTLRLPCKVIIATNDLPKLNDTAGALERRLVPIPFTEPFGETTDRTMKAKVIAEAAGIFLWALRGLVRLRKDPAAFPLTSRGAEMVQEIKQNNAPIYEYLADECKLGPEHWVLCKTFRDSMNEWLKERGSDELSEEQIGRKLKAAAPRVRKTNTNPPPGEKRQKVYIGLRLAASVVGTGTKGEAAETHAEPADPPGPPSVSEPPEEEEMPF